MISRTDLEMFPQLTSLIQAGRHCSIVYNADGELRSWYGREIFIKIFKYSTLDHFQPEPNSTFCTLFAAKEKHHHGFDVIAVEDMTGGTPG